MIDDDAIDAIVAREGGYVNHPADRGGPTKFGVTLSALSEFRSLPVTPEDVEAMTLDEARAIYRKRYLEDTGIWKIPGPILRAMVLDSAVNHGPSSAIKMLQRILKVPVDGTIGSVTLTAVPHLDQWKLVTMYLGQRCQKYGDIIAADASQRAFAAGWFHRLAELTRSVDG